MKDTMSSRKKDIQLRTKSLWPLLGEFTVVFNEIEANLDFAIKEMIDPWGRNYDYIGIFLKDKTLFNQKREMFYGLAKWRINHWELRMNKKAALKQLEFIYKDLDGASQVRNRILHAKWTWWQEDHPEAIQRLRHDITQDHISLSYLKHWIRDAYAAHSELADFVFQRLQIGSIPGPRP